MSGEMVLEVGMMVPWWASFCRTRTYSGLLSSPAFLPRVFLSIHVSYIQSAVSERRFFCTQTCFSCKIPSRRSYCNIAMFRLPNSDEMYPMSRRALWPYAEKHLAPVFQRHVPTQQMSHPTPVSLYPPPQSLRLHSFQHSLMLPSVHCSSVY